MKNNPITPSLDTRQDLFEWTVKIHNLVNKDLGKQEYTAADAITFYHRLGEMGRSPIWTPQDLQAANFATMVKFGAGAIAFATVLGGVAYYFTSKD